MWHARPRIFGREGAVGHGGGDCFGFIMHEDDMI